MSENKKEMLRYFEAAELDTLSPELQERISLAQGLFVELGRLMKSITLYGAEHQSSLNFRTRFFENLSDCLARFSPFSVEVQTYALMIEDQVVYEDERTEGNFVYRFYMDQIRSLSFLRGMKAQEVDQLLDLFLLDWSAPELFEDDAVTLLWEAHLEHVQYTVAQEYNEETQDIEVRDDQTQEHTLSTYLNQFQHVIEEHSNLDFDLNIGTDPHLNHEFSLNRLNLESRLNQREMMEKLLYLSHHTYHSKATSLRENERLIAIFDRILHLFAQSNQMSDLERSLRQIFAMVHLDLRNRLITQWAVPTLIERLVFCLNERESKEAISALSCLKLLYPQSIGHTLTHIEKVDTHWFSPLETLIQSALPHIKIELYRCLKSCTYLQGQRLIKSTFNLLDQDDFIKAFRLAWTHSDQGVRYEALVNLPSAYLTHSLMIKVLLEGISDSFSKIRTRSFELLGQIKGNMTIIETLTSLIAEKKKWDLKDLQKLYCTSALCGVEDSLFLKIYQSDRLSLKPKPERLCALLALAIHPNSNLNFSSSDSSSDHPIYLLFTKILQKRSHEQLKQYAQWGKDYLESSLKRKQAVLYELYYRGSLGNQRTGGL